MGGGGDLYGQPAQQDLASIPRVDTPEDAYEGGLAGAVLADEGVNFAREHSERHILQRADTREGFGDALHLEKRHVAGWHVTLREHRATQKVPPLCTMTFAYGVGSPVNTTARNGRSAPSTCSCS